MNAESSDAPAKEDGRDRPAARRGAGTAIRDVLLAAADRAIRYLGDIRDRNVFPADEAVRRLGAMRDRLPDAPTDPLEVLRLLDDLGSPATVASAGGRYFGYVIGGSHPAALGANWLASAWDQNAVFFRTSPAASIIEKVALAWILDLLELGGTWCGAFVTGTTAADVAGLAAARHSVLRDVGWDVERDGLYGAPPVTVIAGDRAHATLFKALRILGMGKANVRLVPTDSQGRMRPAEIPRTLGPAIVCAQAGDVDSGACDALPAVLDSARAIGAWTHVDAAFGLWARAAPARAHLLAGLDGIDSCAADLHKWLNVPYDSGVVLVRRPAAESLLPVMDIRASYLPEGDDFDPGRLTLESSRRARGVDAWATLLCLGRSGVADLVERCCAFATRFADGLRTAGHEVLNEVQLNQVLVSFGPDDVTRAVIDAVQADNTCWCSGTTWNGRAAMRISVSSWATTEQDVERSLAAILRVARSSGRGAIRGSRHDGPGTGRP